MLDVKTANVIKQALIPRQGDSLSEKSKQVPPVSSQTDWENHSSGTDSPDKATDCVEKSHWTNDWKAK